jgi:hypothetical protein
MLGVSSKVIFPIPCDVGIHTMLFLPYLQSIYTYSVKQDKLSRELPPEQ